MAVRYETLVITQDNTARHVNLKENTVKSILEGRERPNVFIAKDGSMRPIKDMLVRVIPHFEDK